MHTIMCQHVGACEHVGVYIWGVSCMRDGSVYINIYSIHNCHCYL